MPAKDVSSLEQQLSAEEANRFARFMRPQRQRQFLLGRALLRLAVGNLTNLPPAAISTVDRAGKAPQLLIPSGCAQPGFSLAHSRDWIACAVSMNTTLGLDIEVVDPSRDSEALSHAGFDKNECTWLTDQPDRERTAEFYRLWSLKEALFKLHSNLGNEVSVPSPIGIDGKLKSQGKGWFSCTVPHPDLSIALCATQPLRKVSLIHPARLTRGLSHHLDTGRPLRPFTSQSEQTSDAIAQALFVSEALI